MPLRIGETAVAELGDRDAVADRGQHVLQRPARGVVVMHVVGRDERQASFAGELHQARERERVVGSAVQRGGEVAAVGEEVAISPHHFLFTFSARSPCEGAGPFPR